MHSQKNFSFKSSDLGQIRHIVRIRYPTTKQQLIPMEKHVKTMTISHQNQSITFSEFVQPQLSNHQSSIKICPHLLDYILHGVNQIYIFYGQEEQRYQTFLGNPSDPGMLMVLMVYLMQQKYKLSHNQLELKVSFLQSNGNQMTDLLTDEKLLLKHIQLSSWIKINEYLEYLKVIKLALYANKKRDFKVSKFDDDKQSKDNSVFIARVQIKLGNQISELVLVDVPTTKKKQKVRNDWQNFLHSFKREGLKTQINQLTQFLLTKLNKGILTMVCSMSLSIDKISVNMFRLKQIQQFISLNPLSKHKIKQHTFIQFSISKIDHLISQVIEIIKYTQYNSIQELNDTLDNIKEWKKLSLIKIKQLGQTVLKILQNRIKIGLYNNICFSQRKDLIGKCVKSQNLKQFYNAKTYQSLYREVDIKTQHSKKNIKQLLKENLQLKTLFYSLKKSKIDIKIINQKIQPLLKKIIRLMHIYFLNQKIILRLGTPYWMNYCLKKIEMEDKIKQFQTSINSIEEYIEKNISIQQCSFKQDLIKSNHNLILKTAKFMENSKSDIVLPKLLFKKIPKVQEVQQKKFQIKLSDFLFKLPNNKINVDQ